MSPTDIAATIAREINRDPNEPGTARLAAALEQKHCRMCGKLSDGARFSGGYIMRTLCQDCKDAEDKHAEAAVMAAAAGFKAIAEAAIGCHETIQKGIDEMQAARALAATEHRTPFCADGCGRVSGKLGRCFECHQQYLADIDESSDPKDDDEQNDDDE